MTTPTANALTPPPARPKSVEPRRASGTARALFGLGSAGCLGLLLVAAGVTPDAAGHGTHTQLGLPPCTWAVAFDAPCMTCGMTTSFALASDGDLIAAASTQPFAFLLALATAAAFWGGAHIAVTGSMLGPAVARLAGPKMLWIALGLLMAAWAYKFLTWSGS